LLPQALVLSMREQNSGKMGPKSKIFPSPRGEGQKYSLRLNLLSGLPSRKAALTLIFQSPLDGSTSNLNVFVMADGEIVPNTAKSRSVRREIAMYQRPFERRSLPLLPG
jgi:hypothetical protein